MAKTNWRKGTPLDTLVQERLRALVKAHGEKAPADLFGLGKTSITRAAAGLPLRRGTIFVIETKMDAVLASLSSGAA